MKRYDVINLLSRPFHLISLIHKQSSCVAGISPHTFRILLLLSNSVSHFSHLITFPGVLSCLLIVQSNTAFIHPLFWILDDIIFKILYLTKNKNAHFHNKNWESLHHKYQFIFHLRVKCIPCFWSSLCIILRTKVEKWSLLSREKNLISLRTRARLFLV